MISPPSPDKDIGLNFCASSFHKGAADAGAFEIGLTRLFKMAINELEYDFATIEAETK